MSRQKLFEALKNVCDFTALESDMDEIERAIITDPNSRIRVLLECIKILTDEEIIHSEINEFLDEYEFPNNFNHATRKRD